MYTIHCYEVPNTPVHTYQWALMLGAMKVADIYTAADADRILKALNRP